jgi:hypothetical protein
MSTLHSSTPQHCHPYSKFASSTGQRWWQHNGHVSKGEKKREDCIAREKSGQWEPEDAAILHVYLPSGAAANPNGQMAFVPFFCPFLSASSSQI